MKKIVIFTCLLLALSLTPVASAAVLVDLDAAVLTEGDLTSWANAGSAGGVFYCAESNDDEVPDANGLVEIVDGRKAVTFAGGAWMESDIVTPEVLTGGNPWSILIWVYADGAYRTAEDALFQWADRGGETGNTAEFSCGNDYAFVFWDDVWYEWAPPTNQWMHLAGTYDGDDVTVYVNGIENVVSPKSLNIMTGHYMRIARAMPLDFWGTHPFTGSIASIQVYDEVLSQEQILQIGGVFEVGTLTPTGLSITEGGASEDITLQIYMNPLTSAGPTEDLDVTLSFAGTYSDAQLGSSAIGEPYVVTVPAATYSSPITVSIIAEDDDVLEGSHKVLVQAEVTAGDPAYVGQTLTPFNGLEVTIVDNDFAPCPTPGLDDGAYVDNFNCQWDYMLGPSSIWTGLMDTAGYTTDATASVTTSGVLRLESANGDWHWGSTSGPFLYIDVAGDFEVETYVYEYANSIAGEDPVYSNAGGICVRIADTAVGGEGEDNILVSYFPVWDCGNILWYNDDSSLTETDITWEGFAAGRYLKLARKGAEFYCYYSYDGNTWVPFPSANPLIREDMNIETLQVGLYQCNFSAETGFVEYDYFSLKNARGTVSGTLNLTEADGDSGTVQFKLDAADIAPMADINVTLTAVAASGADPSSDPEDITIGTSAKGVPYTFTIPAAQYDQLRSIDIAAVVDEIPEPDQQLILGVEIASTDPNWNGLLINSDALINILETPGLLPDTGDGVTVIEGVSDDTFTVRLKIAPLAPVTVDITDESDPAQVTVSPVQLSFDGASWKTPQTVTVTAVDDGTLEFNPHATTLNLTATNGAEYDALDPVILDVSILDNECGAWGYLWADFDGNCNVDISDLAEIAADWLTCSRPYDIGCVDMR